MQKHKKFPETIFLLTCFLFAGCDEGRLYEDAVTTSGEGLNVSIIADIQNAGSWPATYTVSVAAFKNGSDYALISKSIGVKSAETGLYNITLSNLPEETNTIELCVVNRLGQRIATFYSLEPDGRENYDISLQEVLDVNMFDVIQNNIFTATCANCHGASTFAAANLYLTDGKSFENLVGIESEKVGDDTLRVSPGSRSGSLLYRILTEDLSQNWNYDHSTELTEYNLLELIGAWIDNGAKR